MKIEIYKPLRKLAKRNRIVSKRRKPKKPTWSLKKADKVFSGIIRARDGKCLHPGSNHRGQLQCSHYIGRATKSTRYDPENCITICWWHHYGSKLIGWEYQKQTKEAQGFDGQYTLFMRSHLGEERFNALNERAKLSIKQNKAIEAFRLATTQ